MIIISDIFEITPGTAQYAIVIALVLLTAGLLNQFFLDPGIQDQYVAFYLNLAIVGAIGGVFVTVYLGRFILSNLGFLGVGIILSVTAIWIIFFTFLSLQAVATGSQVIGVPDAVTTPLATVIPNEVLTRAFIPALLEDFWYLYVFPGLIAMFMLAFYEFIWPGEEVGFLEYSVAMVIATLAAAFNFTSAHFAAYGNQIDAFIGAFIFAWGQSLVYAFTGLFLPLAHFIHNYIVTVGPQFAIATAFIVLIPMKLTDNKSMKESINSLMIYLKIRRSSNGCS